MSLKTFTWNSLPGDRHLFILKNLFLEKCEKLRFRDLKKCIFKTLFLKKNLHEIS